MLTKIIMANNNLKAGPTCTNTYLPSTPKVFDMNVPRDLSYTSTHSDPKVQGNIACFNSELSGEKNINYCKEIGWLNKGYY